MAEMTKPRPKYLALHQIRLPLAGFASILHRVSGAGLFLMLPLLIYLLQLSLEPSPAAAESFKAFGGNIFVRLILFGLSWAYLHHFCMGIRILLIDVQVGVEKEASHKSAVAVMAISLALTMVVGLKFIGVY